MCQGVTLLSPKKEASHILIENQIDPANIFKDLERSKRSQQMEDMLSNAIPTYPPEKSNPLSQTVLSTSPYHNLQLLEESIQKTKLTPPHKKSYRYQLLNGEPIERRPQEKPFTLAGIQERKNNIQLNKTNNNSTKNIWKASYENLVNSIGLGNLHTTNQLKRDSPPPAIQFSIPIPS